MHEEWGWGLVSVNDVAAHMFLRTSVPGHFWQHVETGRGSSFIDGGVLWMQAPVVLHKQ